MSASNSLLFAVLIFASLVANSYQLECYACTEGDFTNATTNIPKLDEFLSNLTKLETCGSYSDSLLKTCTGSDVCIIGKFVISEISLTARICGPKETCDSLNGVTSEITCETCDIDKCNSASGIVAATFLITLSLIAATYM